jgi:pyruvate dehydrogenase E2 component (dihydrolipoamide acetyltransferase)
MLKVGQTLAQIDASGSAAATVSKTAPAVSAPVTPVAPSAPVAAAPVNSPVQTKLVESVSNGNGTHRPYVSAIDSLSSSSVPAAPIVRAMAHQAGVDLSQVPATGPAVGGKNRVLEEDLLKFLSNQSKPVGTSSSNGNTNFGARSVLSEETERKPLRGLRRVISNAMVKSKYTAPHYSYVDEFECSALVELREEAKKLGEKMGVKISYLPFIVKAVVGALKEFPVVNSSLDEKSDGTSDIVFKKYFHIGIAVATDDGLVVPVIKHADKKTLVEIAREMADLSVRARAGKLTADELKGSTFSITSMGNIGGLFATPIINYPEVGILGVYKVQQKPIVQDNQIVIGQTMHLSLSLDHRVVDGAVGGYFCNAIIERLSNPARLLMEMV